MTKDDLEALAQSADALAEEHSPSCGAHRFARDVAAQLRAAATSSGPAQVATPSYRSNWTTIFGKKTDAGQA